MTTDQLLTHPFCDFCERLHEQAGTALAGLQHRHHLNPNLLLYCYWYAVHHHGLLTKAKVKQLIAAVGPWQERIATPLETLYQQLKSADTNQASDVLEPAMKAKLAAEHVEQLLIAEIFPLKTRRRPPAKQMATQAYANVGTYCQSLYVQLREADQQQLAEIMTHVLPEVGLEQAVALCHDALKTQKNKKPTQQLLKL